MFAFYGKHFQRAYLLGFIERHEDRKRKLQQGSLKVDDADKG